MVEQQIESEEERVKYSQTHLSKFEVGLKPGEKIVRENSTGLSVCHGDNSELNGDIFWYIMPKEWQFWSS